MSKPSEQLAGGLVTKADEFVTTWIGVTYKLNAPADIGALRRALQGIVADLPADDSLTVAELHMQGDSLRIVMETGIVQ